MDSPNDDTDRLILYSEHLSGQLFAIRSSLSGGGSEARDNELTDASSALSGVVGAYGFRLSISLLLRSFLAISGR
jgi:hypothetical protein